MSTSIKDLVCNALLKLSNTIYSPYAVTISNYIYKLEKELAESKKTEEEAVGKLGAAGLELAAVKKERDELKKAMQVPVPTAVVLPKEIAEALERFKDDMSGRSIDYLAWTIPRESYLNNDAYLTLFRYSAHTDTSFLELVNALQFGYTVEKTPDDHVYEQYMDFIMNGEYEAADGILLAIEKLAPGKEELLKQMRAVERLPF